MKKELRKIREALSGLISKSLYKEGLRQTILVGAFAILAMTIFSCLAPINYLISTSSALKILSPQQASPVTIGAMYVLPLIASFQFDFLSKRKACDFYHSLPIKRKTIFASFSLASATWMIVAYAVSALFCCLLYLTVPSIYVNIGDIIILNIYCYIGSMVIYSALLLGISASGKNGTALLIAIFLVVFPTTTKMTIVSIIQDNLGMYRLSSFSLLPVSLLINGLIHGEPLFSIGILFKNILVSALLYLWANITFINRKSELAGSNAPNNFLQDVYRICLTLPIMLFIVNMLYDSGIGSDTFFMILVLLAINIIIYIGYELATTKNGKKMLKSLPKFAYAFVFALAVVACVGVGTMIEKSFSPTEDQISSIRFSSFENNATTEYKEAISSLDIKDEEIIKIVADSLANNEKDINGTIGRYVVIKTPLRTAVRRINISQEDAKTISSYYDGIEEINNLKTKLPNREDILKIGVSTGDYGSYRMEDVSDTQCEKIVDTFFQEYENLTEQQKIEVLFGEYGMDSKYDTEIPMESNKYMQPEIYLYHYHNCREERINISISGILPKTYAMMQELSREKNASEFQSFKSSVEQSFYVDNSGNNAMEIQCYAIDNKYEEKYYFDDSIYINAEIHSKELENQTKELILLTEKCMENDSEGNMLSNMTIYIRGDNVKSGLNISLFLSEENIQSFQDIVDNLYKISTK